MSSKIEAEIDVNSPQGTLGSGGGFPPAREPQPVLIGERLRTRRKEEGLSLRALAREVGVSPSLISQIEHGKATPSVGTLYAIVTELGVSLDELFFEGTGGGAMVNGAPPARLAKPGRERNPLGGWKAPSDGPVLRAVNRLSLTLATGVCWERLTAFEDPAVDFVRVTYPIGSESCPADELMTHEGSEYGIVLEGRLSATVGEESFELSAGDSIAFESTTPHRIWATGDQPCTAIWTVVGRSGDPRVDG